MKVSDFASRISGTLRSAVKAMLQSRPCSIRPAKHRGPLIIMGNGPSLNATIASHTPTLLNTDTMAVNFAALAPEFTMLKPRYYIIADPLFFGIGTHARMQDLYDALGHVDWSMTIFIPNQYSSCISPVITANNNITIETFNNVGIEGYHWFENLMYSHRIGMPRPRNVLISAIMCGIWKGYTEIYITGADHSWMRTISVDNDNNVISVQPHFYKEDGSEQKRVDTTYRGYRLHDIVLSFYTAFRSYHQIARYADTRKIRIFNATPDSFIDAFPRRPLP